MKINRFTKQTSKHLKERENQTCVAKCKRVLCSWGEGSFWEAWLQVFDSKCWIERGKHNSRQLLQKYTTKKTQPCPLLLWVYLKKKKIKKKGQRPMTCWRTSGYLDLQRQGKSVPSLAFLTSSFEGPEIVLRQKDLANGGDRHFSCHLKIAIAF